MKLKKVFDKPISIFEKVKINFENHQRLKRKRTFKIKF